MVYEDPDNLRLLFERFLDPEKAQEAADEVLEAQDMLSAYPAPSVRAQTLARIRTQMVAKLAKKQRRARIYRLTSTAAAVIVVGLVGFLGNGQRGDETRSHAGILPAAMWDSDDIASDDMELAYFASEISRIATEVQAIQSGEDLQAGTSALAELEIKLSLLDTHFWKE